MWGGYMLLNILGFNFIKSLYNLYHFTQIFLNHLIHRLNVVASTILNVFYFSLHIFITVFLIVSMILFTNPSTRAGYDTRSIFKRSSTGLNSVFLLLD